MIVICKYVLPDRNGPIPLNLPEGARILSVQPQEEKTCLWALVDTDRPREVRFFRLYDTGAPIDPALAERMRHLATVQKGVYVTHVFELS